MGDLIKVINTDYKLQLICDELTVYDADIYYLNGTRFEIQLYNNEFLRHKYNNVVINLKGFGRNYTTKPVDMKVLDSIKLICGIYNVELVDNNKRNYKRTDILQECVFTQDEEEYNATILDISLGGAKIVIRNEISMLGIYNLKFILMQSHFNIECRVVRGYLKDYDKVILHLKFEDITSRVETRLCKAINDLQIEMIRKQKYGE